MRPESVYETRARELASAAGLDPEARIPNPAKPGKTMPAWCTFRDAARAEHLAAKNAEVAAELPPQRPEFQNSPLKIFGQHDEATIAQMRNCMGVGNVVGGVICADGHLGYAQPVGGVIAYEKQISISGVGFDIGCGNMAVRLDTPFAAIADRVGPIIKDVARTISFGIGRSNEERVEHELFDDADAWRESDMAAYRTKAVNQLGTVGSGNHYVDLMRDQEGYVWIGVHFGSRGLGHTSATRYLKAAGGKDGMHVPPAVIDEDSELGRRYHRGNGARRPLLLRRARMGDRACAPDHRRRGVQNGCIITTTTPGAKRTTGGISGSCARAQRRRSPASAALSAGAWAMTR